MGGHMLMSLWLWCHSCDVHIKTKILCDTKQSLTIKHIFVYYLATWKALLNQWVFNVGVASHCDASSLHIWLARSVSFRFALKNLFQTYFKRARKSRFPLYVPFKKNVKTNKVCTVRVSPRLSPSGPLKMRHSSICPKQRTWPGCHSHCISFDTMAMTAFCLHRWEKRRVEKTNVTNVW